MKIYTRTGDEGETGLLGGERIPKDDPRIAAIGAIDELNAVLGVTRCQLPNIPESFVAIDALLGDIQHQLFDCGAELASPNRPRHDASAVTSGTITALERAIDRFEAQLPPLREFILPGGNAIAAHLHLARCVCRRAERQVVTCSRSGPVRGEIVQYLNRLGDLLFVLARATNQAAGVGDMPWRKS